MKIPVVGFDPSLRNWGIAESTLDLETGFLDTPKLTTVCPKDMEGKQVRQNSHDLFISEQLAEVVIPIAKTAKAIFVEVPVGSQTARAMTSYGICVGILGTIRSMGVPLIEVTPLEVKKVFTGDKLATKEKMIAMAVSLYPDANFPKYRGEVSGKAEHVADAIATIHAGVRTPVFQNLMRLFSGVK